MCAFMISLKKNMVFSLLLMFGMYTHLECDCPQWYFSFLLFVFRSPSEKRITSVIAKELSPVGRLPSRVSVFARPGQKPTHNKDKYHAAAGRERRSANR